MVAVNIFILDNSYNVKSTDELFYEDYHEWAYERSVKFSDSSIIFGDCFWIVLYEAYGKHIFSGVKKWAMVTMFALTGGVVGYLLNKKCT